MRKHLRTAKIHFPNCMTRLLAMQSWI